MDTNAIYAEMKELLGTVPAFMKKIPADTLAEEWKLFRKIELDEGVIPNKYRALIGLGISAVTKCYYCTLFHTAAARLFGATDEEIESAVRYAKNSAGWSAYLNGMQIDHNEFAKEVASIVAYVSSRAGAAQAGQAGKKPTTPKHVQ